MRPWRAAQARRRPGYPHSNQRPLEPEPPPTPPHRTPPPCAPNPSCARRAPGTWCLAQADMEARVHSLCKEGQESPVPLSGWQRGGLPGPLFLPGEPGVPNWMGCGARGPSLRQEILGFLALWLSGGPGLRPPSGGLGFLSPHSSRFSLLSQEGLGSHCPSQAGRWPGYLLSVDHNVPIGRPLLPLPGEAEVLLPRLADRRKFLSLP